ncbi:MAG: glycosyltransferase family 39 protein [Candidatus Omnitrophica bacterium]|nr:glycosyltransferase family 39 protein [Candidatus Omnitrophota bacterium]
MLEIYNNIIVFILMNSIVAFSAFQFLKVFNFKSFADNILTFALLFCSQIVLTQIILGLFNKLILINLIALNLIILLLTLLFLRKKTPPEALKFSLTSDLLRNKTIIFIISCIIGFGVVKTFVNLINAPFGWDSLNYHFTFPVEWLKNANLINPIVINCDPSPSYYPINGSLLFLWLILPFKNVFLADLGQVPFFILCFIAVFSIARKIGVSKDYAFLSAALFVTIPNFFRQLEIAYVDIILTAFFLITLNFLLLLNENFRLKNLLISAIGLGLFFGTKTIAIPFGAIMSIFFVLILIRQRDYKKAILYLIIFSTIITLLGGFSYIRSFLLTKNFLYPASIKIFGRTVMKGVLDMSYYRAYYIPRDYSIEKLLFHEGLGLQTILLVLPAMFLSIPLTLIKNRPKSNIIFAYLLVMPLLLYLVFRYIIPLTTSRYLYSALGLGLIISFYSLELLKINKKVIYSLAVICIIVSLIELAGRREICYSLLFTGLAWATIVIYSANIIHLDRKIKLVSCGIFFLLFILGLGLIQRNYLQNEFSRYITPKMAKPRFWPDAAYAWDWLNKNTSGNNIAYVGRPVPFPLYGTNLKNDVFYVSVNKIDPARLEYFPDAYYQRRYDFSDFHRNLKEKGNYRGDADYSVWCDNLSHRHSDYLFVYSLHQTNQIEFPIEDAWAKANPGKFMPVFVNDTVHIYKILK